MRKPTKHSLKVRADKLFSAYIRSIGICQWCVVSNQSPTGNYECAHIFSRRYLVTRWSPENALCLCSRHHRYAHDNPLEFAELIKSLYSSRKYYALMRKAHTSVKKIDLNEVITKYTKLLKG